MIVLVEGFEPDALAVAELLAREGLQVRLAGPGGGPGSEEAETLRSLGVSVEPRVDLDTTVGAADVAYLDVWTPETAPRVRALRERGCRLTCSAELVVERAAAPVIGVTGTAGKSTTTSFAMQLLRAAGLDVEASSTGRFGNLWATAELVRAVAVGRRADVVALELTSSHLAFMRTSPRIAVITSFWPDHLELHGSLAAYRSAKEIIVRAQLDGDAVVVNADDPAAASFASLTPARQVGFSLRDEVDEGAFLRSGAIVVRMGAEERELGPPPAGRIEAVSALAALAAVAAAGVPLRRLGPVDSLEPLPHRRQPVGRVAGSAVVDDGMAATPAKTAAALADAADGSVVLIAGGLDALPSGPVHTSPEERALLDSACNEIARTARFAVLFGPASAVLEPELRSRRVAFDVTDSLEQAADVALAAAAGTAVVLFSPMFPVDPADRARFADLVRAAR